ncbi:MAG TPA: hypothetical protein VG144_12000 [Gaiellaceae bacterium]|nr:hypothetical protein [Gaiellaceae bacterium]
MTIAPPRTARPRRPRRGRVALWWLVRAVILALVFGVGVAVGQALEDRPPAEKPVTRVSTITPWTQTQP